MSHYEATCQICQIRQKVYSYGNWTCDHCGQEYKYEEGHMIVLTSEQIEILRAGAGYI